MSRLDAGALPPGPRLPGALQLLATWKRPAGSMERLRARYGQRLTGLMAELADREVESWPRQEPIKLHPRLQRLTLEIILRAVIGVEQGRQLEELRDALTGILAFAENPLSILPALTRYLGPVL